MTRQKLFLAGLILKFCASWSFGADPRISLRSGLIEGKSLGVVNAFLGIPYAAPPVGNLRWKPPQPVIPWSGMISTKNFGPRPMQPAIYKDMVFRDSGPSEDCLTVNVWVPAGGEVKKAPVMVWIYGGGLLAGGTSEERQDGSHLAEQGVIVVSMNYRLGVFGFLSHPELTAESPHHASGNYGLLDQLAALQWVHENIAAFGGDPANVTIFGESAGAWSVSALMASPLARGQFQKAIGQSGSAFSSRIDPQKSLADQSELYAAFLERVTGHRSIAELRTLSAAELQNAVTKTKGPGSIRFELGTDGYFLPQSADKIFAQGQQNDVPLMAGWMADEQGLRLEGKTSAVEALRKMAVDEFGPKSGEFLRLYSGDTEETAARSGAEFKGDHFIAYSTWSWIESQVATGQQAVYRFRFDRAPPTDFFGNKRGAYHSADILYVFGQLAAQPQVPWEPADHATSRLVQRYWVNFARTGNPNGPGLPEWPAYRGKADSRVMHLDANPAAKTDPFRGRYEFLQREWKQDH